MDMYSMIYHTRYEIHV